MKKVFDKSEVAHIWARQTQSEGRNSGGNFYFDGATIYSYGRHFPIATIEGQDVLFTLRGYSNTTARHIQETMRAVSHKNIIYCQQVPVKHHSGPLNKQSFTSLHESNTNYWKGKIKTLFEELGNKRNRDTAGRISEIKRNIEQLQRYYEYFGLKVKDGELKKLLAIANAPDFVEQAREAKAKTDAAKISKLKSAAKAYEIYLKYWRQYDEKSLQDLPEKTKELCNYYINQAESFTRLRYNTEAKRVETSKGVQIPVEIAKRTYIALNGCMVNSCTDLPIPVMDYTITETGTDYIKAGCHTIPKEDIKYIAGLLNW